MIQELLIDLTRNKISKVIQKMYCLMNISIQNMTFLIQ